MSEPVKRPGTRHSIAGAAGAGGGTLVAALGIGLDESNSFREWILLAAPSFSVVVGVLWLWVQVRILNYFRDREVRSLIASARSSLEEALNNSSTYEAHRKRIRKNIEELELITINRTLERVRSLTVITEDNMRERGIDSSDITDETQRV